MLTVSASYRRTEKRSQEQKKKGPRPGDAAFVLGLQKSWPLEVRLLLTQK